MCTHCTHTSLLFLQVYTLEVTYPLNPLLRTKIIHRRYSEFAKLRVDLTKENLSLVSALPFPQKQLFRSNLDRNILQERLAGLKLFLGSVLKCKELKTSKAFQLFLNLSPDENSNHNVSC